MVRCCLIVIFPLSFSPGLQVDLRQADSTGQRYEDDKGARWHAFPSKSTEFRKIYYLRRWVDELTDLFIYLYLFFVLASTWLCVRAKMVQAVYSSVLCQTDGAQNLVAN